MNCIAKKTRECAVLKTFKCSLFIINYKLINIFARQVREFGNVLIVSGDFLCRA